MLGEEKYSSLKGKEGVEQTNDWRDLSRSGAIRPEQQKYGVSSAGVLDQAKNGRWEPTTAEASHESSVTGRQIGKTSSWVTDRVSSGLLVLKQKDLDLVGKGEIGAESELLSANPVGAIEDQQGGSYGSAKDDEIQTGSTVIGKSNLEIHFQAQIDDVELASLTIMATSGKRATRQPSLLVGLAGIPGSSDPVDGNDGTQLIVGAAARNPDEDVIAPATVLSCSLMEPGIVAGDAVLAMNGYGVDSSNPVGGGSGGRPSEADGKMTKASPRKANDVMPPMRIPWRGKLSESEPLNGSNRLVEQNIEYNYGCLGSHGDPNVFMGDPVQMTYNRSQSEQNGRYEVEMDAIPMGVNEIRNTGNSSNNDNRGTMGNGLGGNSRVINGDSNPVKSWKSLVSIPVKSGSPLQFYRPHCADGKLVAKPPAEAVNEGIDMWKGCLVGQFLDKRLPFPVVHSLVNRLWGKREMPDISTTENGLFFFRFNDLEARDWVMDAGPWHLAGRPFILRAWKLGMDMLNIQLSSIPIWVRFYNIPLEYWTSTCLGHIASTVGIPLHLDPLTENQTKLSFARIFVEVGVDCEFPTSVLLDRGNGNYSTIKVEYAWAPQCCTECKLFGHNLINCPVKKGPSSG